MPEGPEIRLAADRVAAALVGHEAREVFFGLPRLKRFEDELRGLRVEEVTSRGKAMLVRFADGWTVYSHNQLYGKWFVRRAGVLPDTRRSLRFAIHNGERSALLYSASEIDVLRGDEVAAHPYLSRLGPDILDGALRPVAVARRVGSAGFGGRSLGALLLDQSFLAGVGNYLRSEILHRAGLHPSRKGGDLGDEEARALGRAVRLVSRRAYRDRGVTIAPPEYRRLRAAGEPRRTARHAVFNRRHRSCRTCGSTVRRIEHSGRRLYLCPGCQPG